MFNKRTQILSMPGVSVAVLSLLLGSQAVAKAVAPRLGLEGFSGVIGPKFQVLTDELKAFAAQNPQWVDFISYGKTVQGRELSALRIWNHRQSQPNAKGLTLRKTVLISGATHGNEFLGLENKLYKGLFQFAQGLPGASRFLNSGGVLLYVPILNPDGYEMRQRENANGVDLNRDFPLKQIIHHPNFTQPETKFLSEWVHKELTQLKSVLSMSMDYHCCVGALLYPYSYAHPQPPKISDLDLKAFLGIGEILHSVFGKQYPVGTSPDVLGYDAIGTTKDFYFEKYASSSFTFEGEGSGSDLVSQHLKFWDILLGQISDTPAERWISPVFSGKLLQ